MQEFRVAATQASPRYDDLDYNVEMHLTMIRETVEAGCQLVVFPELSVTGHNGSPDIVQFAQEVDGPVYRTIREQAMARDVVVGYGYCELFRGTHYNSYALVGPAGLIGIQRKVHHSYDELFRFRQAYEWEVFDLGFCRVGTAICYDGDFPESWRILALKGAEVVLLPHAERVVENADSVLTFNGLEKACSSAELIDNQKWLYESRPNRLFHDVNARWNGVYAVFSSQVGFDGHSSHVGGAYVLDPTGRMVGHAAPSPDNSWVAVDIDPHHYAQVRHSPWFHLKRRRPETYSELTREI